MSTTRTTEPTRITQGERIEWTKTLPDYPASEWTLAYRFRSSAGPGFNVTATADGDDHDLAITKTVSAGVPAGRVDWQSWVTEIADSNNTKMIGSGRATVIVGFTADAKAAVELRSPAKIALDAIVAAISEKATKDQLEYELTTPAGSRKVKRMSMKDLLDAQKHFAGIVAAENARERARQGKSFGQQVLVRMYDED